MEFKKYQHIERYGTTEVDGIDLGLCYVFPKIDGTNASLWVGDNLEIKAGSRNRELTLNNDNADFYNWVSEQKNIQDFFSKYPNIHLYGEWLVPHALKTYRDDAWRNFYVFDVMEGENYIQYEEYKKMLDEFNIEYIPPLCTIENPTFERLNNQLQKNEYLIKDGNGIGEGVIIKNYSYVNKFGRQTWAKIVTADFKVKHAKVTGVSTIKEKKMLECEIVDKYITTTLINKEFEKIKLDSDGGSFKFIPRLLQTVYYCLITEECWNFIKENKYPSINFKTLQTITTQKIKELKPNLF